MSKSSSISTNAAYLTVNFEGDSPDARTRLSIADSVPHFRAAGIRAISADAVNSGRRPRSLLVRAMSLVQVYSDKFATPSTCQPSEAQVCQRGAVRHALDANDTGEAGSIASTKSRLWCP